MGFNKKFSSVLHNIKSVIKPNSNVSDYDSDNDSDNDSDSENSTLPMVLYFATSGSLEGRNELIQHVSVEAIDCTGGQCACEDGDLEEFGNELVAAARQTGYKIFYIYRMDDPGLGLCFTKEWVEDGLASGRFQSFPVPDDVLAS